MDTVKSLEDKGLLEAIRFFSDPQICVEAVANVRWPDGPFCPKCLRRRLSFLKTRLMWKCLDCKKQFSVKVGTIFEDSPVGLDKWLTAMWMLANCKNGISSYEIGRGLGVTQKTAWFMLQRIRYAMHHGTFNKMTGTVEADETFIGGKARKRLKKRGRLSATDAAALVRPSCLGCLNARLERSAHRSLISAASGIFKTQFMTTLRRARRFTRTRSIPMTAWIAITRTRSLTTLKPT
jgi:transposase-like protein